MSDAIAHLARRAEDDSFFLAFALRCYARSEGIDDAQLAQMLGCPIHALPMLALCRRPRSDPSGFSEDVDVIACRFQIDAATLAEIVRRADALAAMSDAPMTEAGFLMAARDRESDQDDGTSSKGEP